MQTNPVVEQNENGRRRRRKETLNGPRVRRISPIGKEKVYGGNDLPKMICPLLRTY